ncbi:TPA: accessory gene regulator B family protein [Enterococcus faecium]|nr:hypothetical protein [Enterococcus faecium]
MVDFIAEKIFDVDKLDDSVRSKWVRYYIESYLVGASKVIEILIAAFLLKSMTSTFIVYICLFFLRGCGGGWHANTKWRCTIETVTFYVLLPSIITKINILMTKTEIVIVGFLFLIGIWYTTFIDSKSYSAENFVCNRNKNCLLLIAIVLFSIALLLSNVFSTLIIFCLFIQLFTMSSLTKKIIEGGKNE